MDQQTKSSPAFEPLGRPVPRIGVLGAAQVAPQAITHEAEGLVELRAVAARDVRRAEAFAAAHGVTCVASSYADLIERDDVDVVYVALPAALHAHWVARALAAGKHVLCEKPFGLSAAEAEDCVQLATDRRRLLMEAHHWRYHPLVAELPVFLEEIGELREVEMVFDGPIRPGDIRLEPTLGAGVLLDFGCYLLQWQNLLTGDPQPEILHAAAVQAAPGVEVAVLAELQARGGVRVSLACDMRPSVSFRASFTARGTRGQFHFDNPLATQGSQLTLEVGARRVVLPGEGPSTYRSQLQALVEALRTGTPPPTSGRDIVETQAMLDALVRSCHLPPRAVLAQRGGGMTA